MDMVGILEILETNAAVDFEGTSPVQKWLSFIFPGRVRIVYMSGMYNSPGELQLLTNVKIFLIPYLEVYVSCKWISLEHSLPMYYDLTLRYTFIVYTRSNASTLK